MTSTPNSGGSTNKTAISNPNPGTASAQAVRGLEKYPKLSQCWQDKLGEVDQIIVDFYGQTGWNPENLAPKVLGWFRSALDTAAQTEFDTAKKSPEFLHAQIASRVEYLHKQGLLKNYQAPATALLSQQAGQTAK